MRYCTVVIFRAGGVVEKGMFPLNDMGKDYEDRTVECPYATYVTRYFDTEKESNDYLGGIVDDN